MAVTPTGWRFQALYGKRELCLIGDAASFDSLGSALQQAPEGPIMVDLVIGEPAPYDGCFRSLLLEVTGGPVVIGRDEAVLRIQGGPEQMATLGSNLSWLATNEDPADPLAHIHLEHLTDYPDGYYIGPDSLPLVAELVSEI
jgi:hypothetical protein